MISNGHLLNKPEMGLLSNQIKNDPVKNEEMKHQDHQILNLVPDGRSPKLANHSREKTG